MNIKKCRLAVMFFIIIFTFGCSLFSSGPDEKTIQNALFRGYNLSSEEWTMTDFKITNKYTKELNKETVYVYETKFKLKSTTSGKFYQDAYKDEVMIGTIGLVKRGNSWYLMKV